MFTSLRHITAKKWVTLSLINFLIVGILGLTMRLKFLYPILWIDQSHLLHAHSHFAFSAWVSQTIMVFMIVMISEKAITESLPEKYQSILWTNLMASYGMLISFSISGYSVPSIVFSTVVLVTSYWFTVVIWQDLKRTQLSDAIKILIKSALIYNVISSLGTFALIYLKVLHQLDPLKQLASIYFYLHFQYNGWFFLGCLALFNCWVFQKTGKTFISKWFSFAYAFTVIPTYFLSILWWKGFPTWLYVILLISVLAQIILWSAFLRDLLTFRKNNTQLKLHKEVYVIWSCVILAVCLKLILQTFSIIPSLSQFVYGFRPIAIAYLHLVLLVIISLFIIGYAFQSNGLAIKKKITIGIYSLLFGIFLNEFILMLQGIGVLLHQYFHYINHFLLLASFLIVSGICQILYRQRK